MNAKRQCLSKYPRTSNLWSFFLALCTLMQEKKERKNRKWEREDNVVVARARIGNDSQTVHPYVLCCSSTPPAHL